LTITEGSGSLKLRVSASFGIVLQKAPLPGKDLGLFYEKINNSLTFNANQLILLG
jgi:hypothetical protein